MQTTGSWQAKPYAATAAARIADALSLSAPTAAMLVRRGFADPAAARAFLGGAERSDPFDLPGAEAACEVILRHAAAGSRAAVFGDYDVDGVCSTAMMVRTLRALGADPLWRLPTREEGYGLSEGAVEELARAGARLLVTVDCGVASVREAALARELGLDVVITDHHRPGPALPDCPVVHPGLGPGRSSELCAAGVVLKLSQALRLRAGLDGAEHEQDSDLAGLATVCDMVPLHGENRRIAREGLAALARTRRPGLRALMQVAALDPGEVDARSASFRLGPRINAAGRLRSADAALELLLTEDEERAREVAEELDGLNHDRREAEQRILFAADAACAGQLHRAALVVAGEGWHPGVVGIVASRLVERHRRPCVVIGLSDGRGRGSGRSIAPYDLHEGLGSAAEHLLRFGGHRMAVGLELEQASVDRLRAALATHAGERLCPADLVPEREVDAVVPGGSLSIELAEELERLGPFGAANPAPRLLVPAARVEHVTAMGEDRAHARFSLRSGGARARGVAFRTSQRALAATGAEPHDVVVSLERNRWNGAEEARIVLDCLCPSRPGTVHDEGAKPFWAELDAELEADPSRWWPEPSADARRPSPAPAADRARLASTTPGTDPPRGVRDRRGEGFAGVAGDLLTSGEPVLVLVADVERRRASLEANVAGMGARGLAVVSWPALGAQPDLAGPYTHLLALDPPPVPAGVGLMRSAPGAGLVHLVWGRPERDFSLACWRHQLDLRPGLAELWRTISDAGPQAGDALELVLRGSGVRPRSGAHAGRLLRVLRELGLAEFDATARRCAAVRGPRTQLERSSAMRAYTARLRATEAHLTDTGADEAQAAEAS